MVQIGTPKSSINPSKKSTVDTEGAATPSVVEVEKVEKEKKTTKSRK